MKLNKGRHGTKMEINMTPMIDVTFLLLIFFMTVNQVAKVNSSPVELPLLAGSQDQSEATITINVDESGDVIVSGNTISMPELVSVVSTEVANQDRDPSRVKVVLRADRRGNCRTVNDVVSTLVRLDITSVRVAVRSGQE